MAWEIRRPILVPFDFGDSSHRAIDKAIELANDSSQIHVTHVIPPFIPLAPDGIPVEWGDDQQRLDLANALLQREFSDTRYQGIQLEVIIGDPGEACADRASELDAELIILPSHGRVGLARLILGSVAEQILRLSKCPVLVLKL